MSTTKFTIIYDRFLSKITDDMYMELTPQDTLKDLQNLLINSLPDFEFPRKNLQDYTIETQTIDEADVTDEDFIIGVVWSNLTDTQTESTAQVLIEHSSFGCELTSEEINIIALLMLNNWLQRQITSIENIRMKYSGSDFKMTSQANHLSKLLSLQTECQRQAFHLQRLYKRRELTSSGLYQSTWYKFGDNNATS